MRLRITYMSLWFQNGCSSTYHKGKMKLQTSQQQNLVSVNNIHFSEKQTILSGTLINELYLSKVDL